MKPQTELTLRSVLSLDKSVNRSAIDRAVSLLKGSPTHDDDLVRVMPYREVLARLKVNKYTLRYYVKRGYLTKVLGAGNRAIGVTWESFHRFTRARTRSCR